MATIVPLGPFSLRAAATFGFGPTEGRPPAFHDVMRLAFPVDGGAGSAGAVLRRPREDGPVEVDLELRGDVEERSVLAQVARTVSLDHDGAAFIAVGERDPTLGALQRAHPGQRPVLFPSPYEAAAWAVLSARRPARAGATVRAALGAALGETFTLAGETVTAFPTPAQLTEIPDAFPGLGDVKVKRLRDVAAAALAGQLDVGRLHELGPERAYADVQSIPGIGPFSAALIVLRASGFADAWLAPLGVRVTDHLAGYYGDGDPSAIAEGWRPFRTWALVLMRVAGTRGTVV